MTFGCAPEPSGTTGTSKQLTRAKMQKKKQKQKKALEDAGNMLPEEGGKTKMGRGAAQTTAT